MAQQKESDMRWQRSNHVLAQMKEEDKPVSSLRIGLMSESCLPVCVCPQKTIGQWQKHFLKYGFQVARRIPNSALDRKV